MCGVFGYVGERDPVEVCLLGLEQLEYRGYDSTGISGIYENQILCCKKAGKLSFLKQELKLPKLRLAIAHTRWATHGRVNDQNAHPHLDTASSLAIIHNGIIENYAELREDLKKEGCRFLSETDTEVIAHLIAKHYQGDLVSAIHQASLQLKGLFAFVAIHKDHPEELYAAAHECPLSIGFDDARTEAMISSDPNTFHGINLNILFLRNGEIARVSKKQIDIYDQNLQPIVKKTERAEGELKAPSKEGFPHYMLKEMFEQPASLQRALFGRFEREVEFEKIGISDDFLKKIKQVWFIGCGTSAHAGKIGALFFEDIARIPSQCEIASEARYRMDLLNQDTLIIAISQSGETADTLTAMREARKRGCKILVICNVKSSTMMREADGGILMNAGPEISVCSTKAFTSELAVLFLLTLYFARLKQHLERPALDAYLSQLKDTASQMQQVLDMAPEIEKIAKKYSGFDDFFFMGRRYMYPTASEASLKLKEISYANANSYPAGELKHGPISLLSPQFPVIAFCANEQTQEKIVSNLTEVKARGAPILAIASNVQKHISSIADDLITVPHTIDALAPFPSAVAGQLLAYYIAKERGCDIDQPRYLAKSVTVE